jgi:hypothetical protein
VTILPLRQTCPLVRKSRRDSSNRCVHLAESTFKRGSDREPNHSFLHCHFSSNLSVLAAILFPCHGRLTHTPVPAVCCSGTWFYCENHEPSLLSFVAQLLEFQGTWSEEPTPLEAPQVDALIDKVNLLKEKGLTRVCIAAHWLACRVQPLKKQVHSGWEYSGLQDPTRETQEKMAPELLVKHLGEIFQDISTWLTDEQVRPYQIGIERDPVRHPT